LLSRAIGAINGVGDVLDIANKFKNSGISYKFGANDVNNKKLDCSSFTQNVFAQAGYSIGRTTKDQVKNTKAVALKDAVPGDLVFFQGTYRPGVSHVGVYMGNGQFVHNSSKGKGIIVSSLNEPYYKKHWYGARRASS
jgi:cell wall-associated NlpC family hydrolase